MENKIEIGEYIRTKTGIIAKVVGYQELKVYDNEENAIFYSFDTDKGSIADVDVLKHSANIIDVIEVGDYVNGIKVTNISRGNMFGYVELDYLNVNTGLNLTLTENKIRTIVTKEQIFDKIWGFDSDTTTNVVEVYASELRKTLKKYGYDKYIKTIRGVGYMIS